MFVQIADTPTKPLCVACAGGVLVGAVNVAFVSTTDVTVIDTAVAALPAKSLAFNVTSHLPAGKPAMDTVYATLLPGLLAPVTVIDDAEIAAPLYLAVTEVAFKSPRVSVIVAANGVPVKEPLLLKDRPLGNEPLVTVYV